MLASGGERGSGAQEDTPLRGRGSGPSFGRGSWAGRRSALGSTPAGIPGWTRGRAPRRRKGRGGGSREPADGLPSAGGEGCMWSRCALRAESASCSPQPGDVKARARGSGAVPAALLPLRSASRYQPGPPPCGQRREASRPAAATSSHPRQPSPDSRRASRLISDAAVGVCPRWAGDHPSPA